MSSTFATTTQGAELSTLRTGDPVVLTVFFMANVPPEFVEQLTGYKFQALKGASTYPFTDQATLTNGKVLRIIADGTPALGSVKHGKIFEIAFDRWERPELGNVTVYVFIQGPSDRREAFVVGEDGYRAYCQGLRLAGSGR